MKSYCVQFTFYGDYEFRVVNLNNADDLNAGIKDNITYIDQRLTLKSTFEINENTKGVVALESGRSVFGIDTDNSTDESVPGDDSIELKLKNMYVDFILPNKASGYTVGLQPVNILDGLLANEDAFGITYFVDADALFEIRLVKINANSVNDEYSNDQNEKRSSHFISMFLEDDIFKEDLYTLLVGQYTDKEAVIDGIEYHKRSATYFGLGYKWEDYGFDCALNFIVDRGRKDYKAPVSRENVSVKSAGYLVDLTVDKPFNRFDMNFEFLMSTGDDNDHDDKDREFMSMDGLTNFYDRAYIMTGYITGNDSDEKTGIFDTEVYNITNVVFLKLGGTYKAMKDKKLDLSVMYAINNKKVETVPGRKSSKIGTEIDATFTVDLFDTYYENGDGLLFTIFSAYFIPGDNYRKADGTDSDDVYLLGTGLEYIF